MQVSKLMFKFLTNLLAANFSNYFVITCSVHSYNTRKYTDFHLSLLGLLKEPQVLDLDMGHVNRIPCRLIC